MSDEPVKYRRRSLRLKAYDYAQAGAYFVTICTHGRVCLFGEIKEGSMHLNAVGQLAATLWNELPARFPAIELDCSVVMPNHAHGIIVLSDHAPRRPPSPAPSMSDVVGAFKSLFAVEYVHGVKENRWPSFRRALWQRNYYEHVIRDESELARVRRYIEENPLQWEFDQENPKRVASRP